MSAFSRFDDRTMTMRLDTIGLDHFVFERFAIIVGFACEFQSFCRDVQKVNYEAKNLKPYLNAPMHPIFLTTRARKINVTKFNLHILSAQWLDIN